MRLYFTLVITVLIFFSACSPAKTIDYNIDHSNGKILAVVSIPPQVEFVEAVGGRYVDVTSLMPIQDSPHTYGLGESNAEYLEEAEVYFAVGTLDFESDIESDYEFEFIDTSEGIVLRNHENDYYRPELESDTEKEKTIPEECTSLNGRWFAEYNECTGISGMHCKLLGGEYTQCGSECRHLSSAGICSDACVQYCTFPDEIVNPHLYEVEEAEEEIIKDYSAADPHVWLSPKNAMHQIEIIYDTLSDLDPTHRTYYRKNADKYLMQLQEVDLNIKDALSSHKDKSILVYHPAWGYFTDSYGLKQVALEHHGSDPTPMETEQLRQLARAEDITAVFIQPQFPQTYPESLANQINGKTIEINPLSQNYIDNLNSITSRIKNEFTS